MPNNDNASRNAPRHTSTPVRPCSATPRPPDVHRQAPLTVIVPAYNEAGMVAETVASIRAQSVEVAAILVVDDGSSDDTERRAAEAGASVLRPSAN